MLYNRHNDECYAIDIADKCYAIGIMDECYAIGIMDECYAAGILRCLFLMTTLLYFTHFGVKAVHQYSR